MASAYPSSLIAARRYALPGLSKVNRPTRSVCRERHAILASELESLHLEDQGMLGCRERDLGPGRGPAVGAVDEPGQEVGRRGAGHREVERRRDLAGPEDARLGRLVAGGLDPHGVALIRLAVPDGVTPAPEFRGVALQPRDARVIREHQALDDAERRQRLAGLGVGHAAGDGQHGGRR